MRIRWTQINQEPVACYWLNDPASDKPIDSQTAKLTRYVAQDFKGAGHTSEAAAFTESRRGSLQRVLDA